MTVYHRIGHRDRGEESSLRPRYSDSATTICPILTCDYHIIEMRSLHYTLKAVIEVVEEIE